MIVGRSQPCRRFARALLLRGLPLAVLAMPVAAQTQGTQLPIPQRAGRVSAATDTAQGPVPPVPSATQSPRSAPAQSVSRSTDVPPPLDAIPGEPHYSAGSIQTEISNDVRQTEKQRRFAELQERLRQIVQQAQRPAAPPPDDAARIADAPATDDSPPPPPEPDLSPTEPLAEDTGTDASAVAEFIEDSEPELPGDDAAESVSLPPIIPGAIDRIGLADNLFALKENVLALEMYSRVDLDVLAPADKVWVEYQQACCLRRMQKIPEAQERYRRLVAQRDDKWISDLSKWWLDRIEEERLAREKLAHFEKVISFLKENSDVPTAE